MRIFQKYQSMQTHPTKRRAPLGHVHEQNAVCSNKQNATPLRQLDHLIPVGTRIRQLCASPVATLEFELVFLR